MSQSSNVIQRTQKALKLVNEVEDSLKIEGLQQLELVLQQKNPKLNEFGYDQVILKELIKLVKFEQDEILEKSLDLIEKYYFNLCQNHDELVEMLLYRYGLSSNIEVNLRCLEKISKLVDQMDDSVAKHSKQLLNLADLNTIPSLNPIIEEILLKLKAKLPPRLNTPS